ncbi:MAG: adenylyltransferase/cytidyltransferase family protein [Candidatus Melainabacteria bacterium]|nr:adenylyltransferase/cytidyltransferase family protein [Candidatus Melainabacteria bacterium]
MNVIKIEEIKSLVERLQAQGKQVVATNGCFDILHRGHLEYLTASRALGDVLIVGLNSDQSVRQLKGPDRPINNQEDRAVMLAGLKPVDYVVIFDELEASNFLKTAHPDIYTKGADYQAKTLPEFKASQEIGARIEFIDLVEDKSTTSMLEKLNAPS